MKNAKRTWRLFASRAIAGLAIPVLLPVSGAELMAQQVVADAEIPAAVANVEAKPFTLAECLQIALEKQPALAAQQATLASAQDSLRALQNLRFASLIVREIPIRRKQASLGIVIASAELEQVQRDTAYAVTRTYFSVLYARAQKQVADAVVENLKATHVIAKPFTKVRGNVTENTLNKITVYVRLAESRQAAAIRGIGRATAALKEAMGLEPGTSIAIADENLPEPKVSVSRADIVALALANRGELIEACNLATVTALEIDAQETSCHTTFHTFAGAVDIHSKSVPQGVNDTDYRPGAIGPEMPTTLVGHKKDRVERARALSARACAVADKTRNLIALEAEDAFLKYEEASSKVAQTREAAKLGIVVANTTRDDLRDLGPEKIKIEDSLANDVLAAQAQAQYNEALYNQAISLANLERATGGGYSAGFLAVPSTRP